MAKWRPPFLMGTVTMAEPFPLRKWRFTPMRNLFRRLRKARKVRE